MAFFPSLKHNFIAYQSSKEFLRPDWIFEIHQLWQSGFSRVYSNCCCSCSFEPEIIKIGQSSQKMYSNNREFSRVYDNFKCLYKKQIQIPLLNVSWSENTSCLLSDNYSIHPSQNLNAAFNLIHAFFYWTLSDFIPALLQFQDIDVIYQILSGHFLKQVGSVFHEIFSNDIWICLQILLKYQSRHHRFMEYKLLSYANISI